MNAKRHPRPATTTALAAIGLALSGAVAMAQPLNSLYDAALRNNPNLKARGFEVDRAKAETAGARSRLLPQVVGLVSLSANDYRDAVTADQTYGGKRASLSLRQALFEPAVRRRVDAGESTVAQREIELVQLRLALFSEVLDRYLEALAAQDEQASLDAEIRSSTQQVNRLEAMRERQMARVTDLAEARAYAQGLVTRMIDARNSQATALARLTELSGTPVARVPAMARRTFDPLPGMQQEWTDAALSGSPRLKALARALESARHAARASDAERLPQLAATLSHVYADQGFDNRRQNTYHATSLGLELRVPLYEGGRVDALQADALARVGSAEQQLEAARREVEREAITLWLNAQANHARIGSTEAEVKALEQSVQAQEVGLELGATRVIDLLEVRRRLLRARTDQAKARYDYMRDVVALQLRRGKLAGEDVVGWTGWFENAPR